MTCIRPLWIDNTLPVLAVGPEAREGQHGAVLVATARLLMQPPPFAMLDLPWQLRVCCAAGAGLAAFLRRVGLSQARALTRDPRADTWVSIHAWPWSLGASVSPARGGSAALPTRAWTPAYCQC